MKLYSQPQTINGPFLVHKRYSIYCLVGADGHALLVVARGGVVRVDDGVGGHTVGVVGLGPGVDGVDIIELGEEEEGEHPAQPTQGTARQQMRRHATGSAQ
jgi:hypothetical protein